MTRTIANLPKASLTLMLLATFCFGACGGTDPAELENSPGGKAEHKAIPISVDALSDTPLGYL